MSCPVLDEFFKSCTFLRLLIRKPISAPSDMLGRSDEDQLESATVCSSLAASILKSHAAIREENLKYCFPFSHYLTSATMVMMGLMTTEPTLKKRHGSLVLNATRSLNLYCHRIWVSGKMIRWVSRLNLLVQRLLNSDLPEDRSRRAPDMSGHTGSEQTSENVQLMTQTDTQDLPQPACPQSGDCMDEQPGQEVNGVLVLDHHGQMILTPEEHREPVSPYHHANDRRDKSSASLLATGIVPARQQSLPEWVLSDFDFETFINGDGTTLAANVPGELSHQPRTAVSGSLQDMNSRDPVIEEDMNSSVFGALGPAGMFNLDFEVEQVVRSMENNTSPIFDTRSP